MKRLATGFLTLTLYLIGGSQAQAAPILGGQLYYTGGDVSITVLPASAGFTSELQLFLFYPSTGSSLFIAYNYEFGRTVTLDDATHLSSVEPGDELVFGIYVQNTGDTFFMGPATRNPDGIIHNVVDVLATSPNFIANVGFEDLFGGGDLDYDDNVFRFEGAIAVQPPDAAAVPEPASLITLSCGVVGLLGCVWRRRSSAKAAR